MKTNKRMSYLILGAALSAVILSTQTACTNNLFGTNNSSSNEQNTGNSGAAGQDAPTSPIKTSTGTNGDSGAGKSDPKDGSSGSAGTGTSTGTGTSDPGKSNDDAPANAQTGSGQSSLTAFLHENSPSRTIKKKDGVAYVTNTDSQLVLVNKTRELESTYVPKDLVKADVGFSFSGDNPKQQLRKVAPTALEKLFAGAKEDGIELKAVSGYRSYASQRSIFNNYAKKNGEEEANTFSAHPGQSEHQTGLSMDVSSASVKYDLDKSFGETKEGKWLKEHAADYGFIIRYELGKEHETGYMYEPWHIRYVGVSIAKEIKKQGVTLEAYMAQF
ncbi:D-alanyl-D-alanine carboxypeptidase family protein [Paenibacillus sp. CF384]|uniref:M15 family metallopeptidase n=1 Tax=Paenibacillus sp. CF384 TaxID=1884382 RepID=UPI00089D316C|nr:M15 family metallopeptidase [Paenibacillus sp. CF384]SDX75134.1 D-alanyl-D-alanine carboxypeptidase [Paenibacillus sp. CF384]